MKYLKNRFRPVHWIVLPIISSMIIPLVIADIWAEIYHRICFPLCGIAYIKRGGYIKIDRHKLKYLNYIQKIYCVYCGYGNGLLAYLSKMAAETEAYWCGIKHKRTSGFINQPHQKGFAEYGNEEEFISKFKNY